MRGTIVWAVSLPPGLASEAEALAAREQRNRSELVREALRQYMSSREWARLQFKAAIKAQEAGVRNEEDVEIAVDEAHSR